MMEKLPEGTVIGQMRASFDWVLSHTARFAGIVVVTVQDSRGFILIDKGKPLAYYFRHGKRVLKGHNAYEYFRSQDAILFELRRYNPEEMAKALEIASAEDKKTPSQESVFLAGNQPDLPTEPGGISGKKDTVHSMTGNTRSINGEEAGKAGSINGEEIGNVRPINGEETGNAGSINREETGREEAGPAPEESQTTGILAARVLAQMAGTGPYQENEDFKEEYEGPVEEEPEVLLFETEDEVVANVGELLLGQIIGLPGVVAVSIFKEGMNILSIGDISLESLIADAEDLLGSAKEVSSVIRTGPFVQMTLQIPAGNVIIAPYWDEYLCILTRPGVNLGQIRKILRDIPAGNIAGQKR
jgi:predicted regulator of Ras-like GTPase activity (Roadblock/LC7/MglB family)